MKNNQEEFIMTDNKIIAVLELVNKKWKERILDGTVDKPAVLQDIQTSLSAITKNITVDTRPDQFAIEGRDGISRITIVTNIGVFTVKNPKQPQMKIGAIRDFEDISSAYPGLQ
jgi:hypothetical protein